METYISHASATDAVSARSSSVSFLSALFQRPDRKRSYSRQADGINLATHGKGVSERLNTFLCTQYAAIHM
jgi:hypothetical protein